jgi:ABC-type amino acid transport substrate-binding protein/ABC-type amino acid transport system permease subunit
LARLGTILCALALVAAMLAMPSLKAQQDKSPDAALARLLKGARGSLPGACSQANADRLIRVLCAGRLRVGIRDYYPLFSTRSGETRQGYEVDVARAIANELGVEVEFVRVNAATRIPLLAEDRIDLAIATMGHNTQRDGQARFIRPHYYQSETTVVGPRSLAVDWKNIPGRTVCVTIGNGSNAELVAQGARLMLFGEAGVLPERLKDETCALAAQDDSFFANSFIDPEFTKRYEQKFGFAQVPWGMAVARDNTEQLARALDLISQIFHRDGTFLDLARANHIGRAFLEKQSDVWQRPECDTDTGSSNSACVLPALNAEMKPTPFAGGVIAFEDWVEYWSDFDLTLPMFKTAPAWSMFKDGVVNSLILITGALAATLGFALLFGLAQGSRSALLRWPTRIFTVTLQSSPIVLTLVIAATIAHAMFTFSAAVAIGASIVALGLANGSNAGQAISEAMTTLRAEPGAQANGLFGRALGRSSTQIVAFLVNAAKGSPIASFIGAPELLSALTDITSFASARGTTYALLLIFYTVIVMIVVWLCGKLRLFLERHQMQVAA